MKKVTVKQSKKLTNMKETLGMLQTNLLCGKEDLVDAIADLDNALYTVSSYAGDIVSMTHAKDPVVTFSGMYGNDITCNLASEIDDLCGYADYVEDLRKSVAHYKVEIKKMKEKIKAEKNKA